MTTDAHLYGYIPNVLPLIISKTNLILGSMKCPARPTPTMSSRPEKYREVHLLKAPHESTFQLTFLRGEMSSKEPRARAKKNYALSTKYSAFIPSLEPAIAAEILRLHNALTRPPSTGTNSLQEFKLTKIENRSSEPCFKL